MTGDAVPELSVVVPARDAAATIDGQLEALLAEEWDQPWEIVVVDNGSRDATKAIVDRYAARDPRRPPGRRIRPARGVPHPQRGSRRGAGRIGGDV